MTVGELIEALKKRPANLEVMVLDGFNGGGFPREINFGPRLHTVSIEDSDESADCEGRHGEEIVVIGCGCY